MAKIHNCRHCGEPFAWYPNKPGYVDECPECLVELAVKAEPPAPSALEELMTYVATHPVTVNTQTGEIIEWKTRLDLKQALKRKGYSPATIEKLAVAYMGALEDLSASGVS